MHLCLAVFAISASSLNDVERAFDISVASLFYDPPSDYYNLRNIILDSLNNFGFGLMSLESIMH